MPYQDSPIFSDPPSGNKLWRYISLKKFISFLERQALFFCRADKFADPFEGASPKKEVQYRLEEQKNIMKAVGGKFDPKTASNNVEDLSKLQKALSSLIIINCWHFNSHESDAMWNLYLKDNEGVSIQTSLSNFKESLNATDYKVNAGKVRYLNYQNDIYYNKHEFPIKSYNTKTPFIHKRNHFEHEQEFRALIELQIESGFKYNWNDEEFRKGKMISVNIDTLIEKVIIPPNTGESFFKKIKKVISKHGFNFPVEKSKMNAQPYF